MSHADSAVCPNLVTAPVEVRFQACLPTPMAIGYWFVSPSSRPDFFAAYERAFPADLAKICAAVPRDDLAIQWDVCQEVLAWEGYFPNRPESCGEDITSMLARLGNVVPEPVELGYHLCYGTPNDEHVVVPTDLANTVEITHGILSGLERPLRYVHVPAPKHRDDAAYYAPLAALRQPEGCGLYLGVIHYDDRDGNRRRIAAAARAVSDFGIATECGWVRSDRPARPASSTATESRSRASDPRTWPRDSSADGQRLRLLRATAYLVAYRFEAPICGARTRAERGFLTMPESPAHRRAKKRAAGTGGRTEVPLRGKRRLDALTKAGGRATEVERSGSTTGLVAAAQRLKNSGARQKVLQVPQKDMGKAVKAMRKAGTGGTVKNMGGSKRWRVQSPDK